MGRVCQDALTGEQFHGSSAS
ncbi:hypothetical protein AJ71_05979, partial [Pseudomonas aeruginosa BWH031]